MITSIFLLFVAAGISFASVAYGFGGLLPMMIVISLAAVLLHVTGRAVLRRTPEPATS